MYFSNYKTCRIAAPTSYEFIKTEIVGKDKNIAVVQLNRPKALNALCDGLMKELTVALNAYETDKSIGAVILTGNGKAFAAGADIKEMLPHTFAQCISDNLLSGWSKLSDFKKPVIAAVNGFALGGGCEVAMMCDIIYAGEKAKFGQPEVAIGLIPGAGGSQRLTRVAGKSKAMEMCLTGNMIDAQEALQIGLVSKVVADDQLMAETIKLAEKICSHSPLIVQLCKDVVNKAYETTLKEGLDYEKRTFHAIFSTVRLLHRIEKISVGNYSFMISLCRKTVLKG